MSMMLARWELAVDERVPCMMTFGQFHPKSPDPITSRVLSRVSDEASVGDVAPGVVYRFSKRKCLKLNSSLSAKTHPSPCLLYCGE